MNIMELNAKVARARGCTRNLITGRMFDFMGDEITDCAECCGCEFGHGKGNDKAGLAGGARIEMRGNDVRLIWSCPVCGCDVNEETTPIDAIPLAEEVSKDPLCFTCRTINPIVRTARS